MRLRSGEDSADSSTVVRPRSLRLVLFGWVLIHAGNDGVWKPLGDFAGSTTCEQVRDQSIANEALHAIGSALADQPADNPMRQQAYDRAARHIRDRYRCEWRGS